MPSHENDPIPDHKSAEELLREYRHLVSQLSSISDRLREWNISIGPWRLTKSVGTVHIAIIAILWHLTALVAGVASLTFWDAKEFSIALIVGSLFGIGSFLSQVWAQGMAREREFIHKVANEHELSDLRILLERLNQVEAKLATHRGASEA
ncbi:hypothetical protein [Amycolatopsis sp. NPDC059021]|uniref:hypothetical protein n=1 Tax=Amycolatopsis sp. NPDC059021 TaxID=3346704 RepID=UPI0036735122